ncbi:MAG: winged helix-turn-helix domain-containing protein [Desulfobulbaceae bacterium]|nr:winged helix-turn-helix domain-containing protein [Desulfobulbaceae bacterium]HIJ79494.1 winged helix-turn-helix domain-containing protein [Deltaproteobacteria bacterium]
MPAKKNKKTDKSGLTETSIKVGKALARSSSKVEQTGQQVKTATQKLVKSATEMAEETFDATLHKIKEAGERVIGNKAAPAKKATLKNPFKPGKKMTVEKHFSELAEDIYAYLTENDETSVDKLTNVMKRRKNSVAVIYATLGWMSREAKISFSKDGANISAI